MAEAEHWSEWRGEVNNRIQSVEHDIAAIDSRVSYMDGKVTSELSNIYADQVETRVEIHEIRESVDGMRIDIKSNRKVVIAFMSVIGLIASAAEIWQVFSSISSQI